jgi:hypothetical protein
VKVRCIQHAPAQIEEVFPVGHTDREVDVPRCPPKRDAEAPAKQQVASLCADQQRLLPRCDIADGADDLREPDELRIPY